MKKSIRIGSRTKITGSTFLGARLMLKDGTIGTVISQDGSSYILLSKGQEIPFTGSEVAKVGEDVAFRTEKLQATFGFSYCTMASLSR